MEKYEIIQEFEDRNLNIGRMISWSKGDYISLHPDNLVLFNCNAIIESYGKIWHGDLDLTISGNKLKEIATIIGEPIYVLSEHDARFGKEKIKSKELISKARWSTKE